MESTCTIDDCGSSVSARGWCGKHYQRWRNHGSPTWEPPRPQPLSAADRLRLGVKRCAVCGEDKALGDFFGSKGSADSRASRCKLCSDAANRAWKAANADRVRQWNRSRERDQEKVNAQARKYRTTEAGRRATLHGRLRQDHGITLADYEEMVAAQGGLCAICKLPPSRESHSDHRLHVDHDHTTGRIRGLLCRYCNTGLGLLEDDLTRMDAALRYLDSARRTAR